MKMEEERSSETLSQPQGGVIICLRNTSNNQPEYTRFYPEDGGSTFLRNVRNNLPDYTG
jgi:hypothetical protein